jgi:hypothetical protein
MLEIDGTDHFAHYDLPIGLTYSILITFSALNGSVELPVYLFLPI